MRIDDPIYHDNEIVEILFNVAGVTMIYNCNAIFNFIEKNYNINHIDYDEDGFPIEIKNKLPNIRLIPEPENRYDKDALRVEAKLKNKKGNIRWVKIGFVPMGDEIKFNQQLLEAMDRFKHRIRMVKFSYKKPNNSLNTPDIYVTLSFKWKQIK